MIGKYIQFISDFPKGKVAIDEPLFKYSTFRIGGNADLFIKVLSTDELVSAVNLAKKLKIPLFIIGGGTNLLIKDKGFRGLIIKNDTGSIKIKGIKGSKTTAENIANSTRLIFLEADSGVSINRLVRFSLDQGLSGLESFLGQPGTIGGATYINAHNVNLGLFFGDFIESAKVLDLAGRIKEVKNNYFQFGYDKSIIQKSKEVVLSVVVKLLMGKREELWQKAQESLEYRRKTQPSGVYTSGCTFRNISKSDAIRIASPNYTCSAGYLLDTCGLKGKAVGPAKFSEKHANFLINEGNARASDVLELIDIAKKRVLEKYGVKLKEEIVIVGD